MPFLPPNQQRQSTEGKRRAVKKTIIYVDGDFLPEQSFSGFKILWKCG